MRISAKADYAARAAVELALADESLTAERIAEAQGIPVPFLHKILGELRRAGIVATQRGPEGGHRLARDPAEITLADVMAAVEGPLSSVRGMPAALVEYPPSSEALRDVWMRLGDQVVETVASLTLRDLAAGRSTPPRRRRSPRPTPAA